MSVVAPVSGLVSTVLPVAAALATNADQVRLLRAGFDEGEPLVAEVGDYL